MSLLAFCPATLQCHATCTGHDRPSFPGNRHDVGTNTSVASAELPNKVYFFSQ